MNEVGTNPYYQNLLNQLKESYHPDAPYWSQMETELAADEFSSESKTGWPLVVVFFRCLQSTFYFGQFLFIGKWRRLQKAKEFCLLSSQEQRVLEMIQKEYSNKEIADALF